jgi:glutaredoxin
MKTILVYSEDGCPWCTDIKKQLADNNILFLERDVQKYKKEWELITTLTENEYVPALCVLDHTTRNKTYLVPDKDFDDINEAVSKVKEILL